MTGNIYNLELNYGENLEKSLFSVKTGDKVKFKNGPSLYGRSIVLFSELPSPGKEFSRGIYHEVEHTILAWLPGSFHYYFTIGHDSKEKVGSGYIHVEPIISLGEEAIPIECIQSITVLSKCLGHFSTWLDRLAPAYEAGYNMIHFSPVQELGDSGSAYCLREQLKLNPTFQKQNGPIKWENLEELLTLIRTKWQMLSVCDIVLNHSANESPWLREHPECTYNLLNTPHLRPAYILDITLNSVSRNVALGELHSKGIPPVLETEDHLNALKYYLITEAFPAMKLEEFYSIDVQKFVAQFQDILHRTEPSKRNDVSEVLNIIQDPHFRRLQSTIDLDLAYTLFNIYRVDCYDEDTRRRRCAEAFKNHLDELNLKIKKEIDCHLSAAVEACVASVRYFRIDEKGPRKKEISDADPLFPRYFYDGGECSEEKVFDDNASSYVWAHNGWVMNFDPLIDFAQPGSNVYIRRELIPWSDSVKLRYGQKEEDCPFLWAHMRKYVEQTATIFDGVRLDNCHSTPIAVAQYMLDAARKIKPNLYVVAELFTNSDLTDNIFVNKLGITSLIRECMSAWDSHEVGRLVYRYGGEVVGSFRGDKPRPRKLAPALFLDLSHDNPHPIEKRSLYDLIPASALVAIATCATGSTLGYDQLVPHHINVVSENRLYMAKSDPKYSSGIGEAKRAFNKLHFSLAKEGYSQVFVDQVDPDIVAVTRFNPKTMESVILISYTAFSWPADHAFALGKGITVPGMAHSILLEAYLKHRNGGKYIHPTEYEKDSKVINGLSEYETIFHENISIDKCSMIQAVPTGNSVRLNLTENFRPGCVVAIRIVNRNSVRVAAEQLLTKYADIEKAVYRLDLSDLNFALYRCSGEGGPTYNVPNFGDLVYQGLQGVMSILNEIAAKDDLGHPLCTNIRAGPWLGDFLVARLKSRPSTNYLGDLMNNELKMVEELPIGLRPWGFYTVVSQVHRCLVQRAISLLSTFVQEGSDLLRMLALCSVQLMAQISKLPPLSENISPPQPPTEICNGAKVQIVTTLAAGLPHFSSGLMRCWGRDTFISLRGLLLLTGRFQEARYHILGFGGCLRHGLIPNLLDGEGLNPRYNCRDAVFWWLYSIKEYVELAPNGTEILRDIVNRIFPSDDSSPTFVDQTLSEVMQEALNVHFHGLIFRERNAGSQIDEHMLSPGFDNQIGIHPETGFVFGGNEWNCGTWMDKMGSSIEAGTKGKPATPRDGSAIEMVGLQFSVINWLSKLFEIGEYPYKGVTRMTKAGDTISWSWKEWAKKIKDNFEKYFWVGEDCTNGYVNRRQIYKDSYGATHEWADFRLRPNFAVAMVVAPELFEIGHAISALNTAKVLEGPLGMKTLDPSDLAYVGNYDNSNNSSDYRIAHGYNYHQGPEWLWLSGYYLRARLKFCCGDSASEVLSDVKRWLGRAWSHLLSSPWQGLPELTNESGNHCHHSCTTQAWSAATFIEVLHDIKKLEGWC